MEWEQHRVQLPEDRYQKGSQVTAENASIIWTDPHADGLSIGVSGLQADLPIGKSIPLEVYIRNDSEETMTFSWPQDANPQMTVFLTDSEDQKHASAYRYSGGLEYYDHASLEPGFGIKVVSVDLENYATPGEIHSAGHVEGHSNNPRLAILEGQLLRGSGVSNRLRQIRKLPKSAPGRSKTRMDWSPEIEAHGDSGY